MFIFSNMLNIKTTFIYIFETSVNIQHIGAVVLNIKFCKNNICSNLGISKTFSGPISDGEITAVSGPILIMGEISCCKSCDFIFDAVVVSWKTLQSFSNLFSNLDLCHVMWQYCTIFPEIKKICVCMHFCNKSSVNIIHIISNYGQRLASDLLTLCY